MVLFDDCDLLAWNKPENGSDTQYYECDECHRFDICNNSINKEIKTEPYLGKIEDRFTVDPENYSEYPTGECKGVLINCEHTAYGYKRSLILCYYKHKCKFRNDF